MNNLSSLSVAQLQRAITLKEQIEAWEAELATLLGSGSAPSSKVSVAAPVALPAKKKKVMSAAARARIAAAQKARWAERKAKANPQAVKAVQTSRPKPKMSAAGRANIIAAQKARWAKIKAARPQPVRQAGSSVSAAARKKMAEAARARWARIRAAKGK